MEYCYDVYRLQVVASGRAESRHWRAALPPLERALTLAPENTATRRQLGKALIALEEYPRAREQLEKVVALEPHNPAAYVDLVILHRTTGDLPAAVRLLESGLALCPEDAGLHYYYGLALIVRGQLADAVPHLETARRLSPEKPLAARDLIMTYFRLSREREAVAVLEEEMARHPEFPTFLVMATRYRIMKHYEAAAASLLLHARGLGVAPNELGPLAEEFHRAFGYLPQ